MLLTIISPREKKTFTVDWLEINTDVGNFVIQPEHAPTVLILKPNNPITFCLKNGKQESLMITAGILDVTRSSSTILVNDSIT